MANPILNPHYAMWAAAGLITGCGLTLLAVNSTEFERESSPQGAVLTYRVARVSPEAPARPFVARRRVSSAQCATPGQVRGVSTSQHCCWYGQRWSSKTASCIGQPFRCPEAHIARGESCVRLEPALTLSEVEGMLKLHAPAFEACARDVQRAEPLWLTFLISPQGQAFNVHPVAGQSGLKTSAGAAAARCIQERLIGVDFARGHRTTYVHHAVFNARQGGALKP